MLIQFRRFPRPIAILLASAKLWCKACLQKLCAFDIDRNEAHSCFCRGRSCIELVTTKRLVLERRYEWGMATCLAQLGFARACGIVLSTALLRAMRKRHGPDLLASAYIREARRANMTFEHIAWRTNTS